MQRNKKPFLDLKQHNVSKCKKSLFFKAVNLCFWLENVFFFLYLNLVKIRLKKRNYFKEKKETFFDYNKKNFSKSKKSHFFSKGLTHAFGQKIPFFLYLDLIKMRLEIILSDFAGKKETFSGIKKKNFSKSKKLHFSKGVNPCF